MGQPAKYIFEERDALRATLNQWDDYFWIDVGGYTRDIELKRRLKAESVDELLTVLEAWRNSKQTFDEA